MNYTDQQKKKTVINVRSSVMKKSLYCLNYGCDPGKLLS